MPPVVLRALAALVVAAVAAMLMSWGRLSAERRRAVSLAASVVGLLFLVMGLGAEGHREAATTAQFLMGEARYVTGHASASASLPYYVATAVCLLLGTLGLAVSDEMARVADRHWFGSAVAVSVFVTAVRFSLEKVVAPSLWSAAVGITWLAPVVGAFFLWRLRQEGRGWRALVPRLVLYGLAVRAVVAVVMVVATRLRLGTHYDVGALYRVRMPFSERLFAFEPGSWSQVLNLAVLPQLTFWPLYTLGAGLLGAAIYAAVGGIQTLGVGGGQKLQLPETLR